MKVWIHSEAPAFTGEFYYRVWFTRPAKKTKTGWYDKQGNQSNSVQWHPDIVHRLAKACKLKIPEDDTLFAWDIQVTEVITLEQVPKRTGNELAR